MRNQKDNRGSERWILLALVVGCAAWIIIRDSLMLLAVAGIVGGLLALHREHLRELRQRVEDKLNKELPEFIEHNKELTQLMIMVTVSRWTKLIWDED